ncbi:hypothetical protein JXA85_07185 [Candidatus Woesearchaeota archaeon]|nr:hypothetical protein [Candidatus Woesearchaeota archaeon]
MKRNNYSRLIRQFKNTYALLSSLSAKRMRIYKNIIKNDERGSFVLFNTGTEDAEALILLKKQLKLLLFLEQHMQIIIEFQKSQVKEMGKATFSGKELNPLFDAVREGKLRFSDEVPFRREDFLELEPIILKANTDNVRNALRRIVQLSEVFSKKVSAWIGLLNNQIVALNSRNPEKRSGLIASVEEEIGLYCDMLESSNNFLKDKAIRGYAELRSLATKTNVVKLFKRAALGGSTIFAMPIVASMMSTRFYFRQDPELTESFFSYRMDDFVVIAAVTWFLCYLFRGKRKMMRSFQIASSSLVTAYWVLAEQYPKIAEFFFEILGEKSSPDNKDGPVYIAGLLFGLISYGLVHKAKLSKRIKKNLSPFWLKLVNTSEPLLEAD